MRLGRCEAREPLLLLLLLLLSGLLLLNWRLSYLLSGVASGSFDDDHRGLRNWLHSSKNIGATGQRGGAEGAGT